MNEFWDALDDLLGPIFWGLLIGEVVSMAAMIAYEVLR